MSVPGEYEPGGETFGPFGSGGAPYAGQEAAGWPGAGDPAAGGVPYPQDGTYPPMETFPPLEPFPAVPGGDGWPANEFEEVLTAALGDPGATPRVIEVLARSTLWVPVPGGNVDEGLPGIDIDGTPHVPVFSSEAQLRRAAPGLMFGVLPALEFARGLPPGVGFAVNPGGAVGIALPAPAVEELCRAGAGGGARVRLWEPEPAEEPVDFLATAAGEFAVTPVVLSARRALGSVEGEAPTLFVGVELDAWQEDDRALAMNALGRALAAAPLPWQVNLLLLDIAQDPVGDWMHGVVEPFYTRD